MRYTLLLTACSMWLLASCGVKERTSAKDQDKLFAKTAILADPSGEVDGPLIRDRKARIDSYSEIAPPRNTAGKQ